MSIFEQLSAHFPASAISWRAQTMNGEGNSALALCYIDARDVMGRLDAACGPAGWQDTYAETPKGRLICSISILCDGQWITKSDGAGDTDVEGEKGAISDAFKRCAVKWGIGRYLYDVEATWADCEPMKDRDGNLLKNSKGKAQFKKWTPAGLQKLAKALGAVSSPAPEKRTPDEDALVTDAQRDWLAGKIDVSQVPVGIVCERYGVKSLKEMTFAQTKEAAEWLKTQRKAA